MTPGSSRRRCAPPSCRRCLSRASARTGRLGGTHHRKGLEIASAVYSSSLVVLLATSHVSSTKNPCNRCVPKTIVLCLQLATCRRQRALSAPRTVSMRCPRFNAHILRQDLMRPPCLYARHLLSYCTQSAIHITPAQMDSSENLPEDAGQVYQIPSYAWLLLNVAHYIQHVVGIDNRKTHSYSVWQRETYILNSYCASSGRGTSGRCSRAYAVSFG